MSPRRFLILRDRLHSNRRGGFSIPGRSGGLKSPTVIYLDHNATTPVDPRVREAMDPFLGREFGNPSSLHATGRSARRALEGARAEVASLLGASEPEEIVFTSGGTESDALALFSLRGLARQGILAISAVEHPAVREPARQLGLEGWEVAELPVLPTGGIAREGAEAIIGRGPAMVSVMAANNEYGAIFPVTELAVAARAAGALFHCDAVSALGKIPLDVKAMEVDFLSISAHKIYGPKGIGALYIRRGVDLPPLFPGGGQERRRRGGTENVPGIVGFGVAARITREEMEDDNQRVSFLRNEFEKRLSAVLSDLQIWGRETPRLGNTSAISFRGRAGESLLIALDLAGIAVSTGSACSSGTTTPSPAILALGASALQARGTIRFSFGRDNRPEDLSPVVEAVVRAAGRAPSA